MERVVADGIEIRIIKRRSHGLGFYLQNEDEKALITGLVPGGEAESYYPHSVGHFITAINSESVESMGFARILKLLEEVPMDRLVVLTLKDPNMLAGRRKKSAINGVQVKSVTENGRAASNPNAATSALATDLVIFNLKLQERLSRLETFIQKAGKQQMAAGKRPVNGGTTTSRSQSAAAGKLATRRGSRSDSDLSIIVEHARARSLESVSANRNYLQLVNVAEGKPTADTLHVQAVNKVLCTPQRCTGSMMNNDKPQINRARTQEEIATLAKEFFNQYFESTKRVNSPEHLARWAEVDSQLRATGSYEFREPELTYAAKTAWRNAQRCIGRIQWSKLQMFDGRLMNTPRGMFETLISHIRYATNKGNIRSAITVFKQRGNPEEDYRIWNAQLIRFAGYRQPGGGVIGDPASVEFTEVCQKIGWKGAGGQFDILPLVLSAGGQDPEFFELPEDVVLLVNIKHPTYTGLDALELKWYGVPAVSGMGFDVGGIFFPAVAFSGWFMVTEVARDLCDVNRYDLIDEIAEAFEHDTTNITSLWKDQAYLDLNKAILHSFQTANCTIVDHHSASESFMTHLENEQKLRGGCPADWIWIMPPLGGSLLPVFHQEMLDYRLTPAYDYQIDAWKTHTWKKITTAPVKKRMKYNFRGIARAARVSAHLMSRALAHRIRATIIYATETGKSERCARLLYDMFKYGFNVRITSADRYTYTHLEHEHLLLVVTSTFGNGDAPDNGKEFAGHLRQLLLGKTAHDDVDLQSRHSSFSSSRRHSIRRPSVMEQGIEGPLSNVRFAVFGLGSSSYPKFCAFAHYVDQALAKLGSERILPIRTGDELSGQDASFKTWTQEVFKVACDVYSLTDVINMADAKAALSTGSSSWVKGRYRIRFVVPTASADNQPTLQAALAKIHNKTVISTILLERTDLQSPSSDRRTILVKLESAEAVPYQPGDHLAVFAQNDPKDVANLRERLRMKSHSKSATEVISLEVMAEESGAKKGWKPFERLPVVSLDILLSSLLDISQPPSPVFMGHLATLAADAEEKERLTVLSNNTKEYETWKSFNRPSLLEILEEFPSVQLDVTLLLVELPILQPRFYSVSSSPLVNPRQVHATVGLVSYTTKNGLGPVHEGLCSKYLSGLAPGSPVLGFLRSASGFHLPEKLNVPIYLICGGTGIAPFRGFWQHFEQLKGKNRPTHVTLIFGCRSSKLDHVYKKEIEALVKNGTIRKFYLAVSREAGAPKTYVQNIIPKIASDLVSDIRSKGAHIYICGNVSIAAGVQAAIKEAMMSKKLTELQAIAILNEMQASDRYHEDIFGDFAEAVASRHNSLIY